MNPVPSVESSTYFLFFIEIVFTALICLASGEMLPSSEAASLLNGNVIFSPFAKGSEKKSLTKLLNFSRSTLWAL